MNAFFLKCLNDRHFETVCIERFIYGKQKQKKKNAPFDRRRRQTPPVWQILLIKKLQNENIFRKIPSPLPPTRKHSEMSTSLIWRNNFCFKYILTLEKLLEVHFLLHRPLDTDRDGKSLLRRVPRLKDLWVQSELFPPGPGVLPGPIPAAGELSARARIRTDF